MFKIRHLRCQEISKIVFIKNTVRRLGNLSHNRWPVKYIMQSKHGTILNERFVKTWVPAFVLGSESGEKACRKRRQKTKKPPL